MFVLPAAVLNAQQQADGWKTVSPREEIRPIFETNVTGHLRIRADGRAGLDGHWEKTFPIKGGQHDRFRSVRLVENIRSPRRSTLVRTLWRDHGVRTLLCEGGPTLYGSLIHAQHIDDEFLTLSPILIGSARGGPGRPSLVEGIAFAPAAPPTTRLLGVRRAGDYLFLRSRYVRRHSDDD